MAGDKKFVNVSSLKKGSYIIVEGVPSVVSDIKISAPGKHGHAKANIMATGIIDDKKRNMVTGDHQVEAPIIGKKNAQVLSVSGDMVNVMDMETYETFDLPIPDHLKGQVTEGATVLYWEILDEKIIKQVKNE